MGKPSRYDFSYPSSKNIQKTTLWNLVEITSRLLLICEFYWTRKCRVFVSMIRDSNFCIRRWPCCRRRPPVPPSHPTQRPTATWTAQACLVEHRRMGMVHPWLIKFTVSRRSCRHWDTIEPTVKLPPELGQVIETWSLTKNSEATRQFLRIFIRNTAWYVCHGAIRLENIARQMQRLCKILHTEREGEGERTLLLLLINPRLFNPWNKGMTKEWFI